MYARVYIGEYMREYAAMCRRSTFDCKKERRDKRVAGCSGVIKKVELKIRKRSGTDAYVLLGRPGLIPAG
jgi:hypothetical protein